MVAAEEEGQQHRQYQTERGPVAVGDVAAREIGDGRNAVQDAATVGFDARIQHIFPVVPGNGRCHGAHETATNDQRIEDGEQLLLVVGALFGHSGGFRMIRLTLRRWSQSVISDIL